MTKPNREPWHPPVYEKQDVRAIQALAEYAAGTGVAPSPSECKRALDWIIHNACGTYDEPFRPGDGSVRDYLLGRRSVGLAIIKLMYLKPRIFDNEQGGSGRTGEGMEG
jgi:hypothetical protein